MTIKARAQQQAAPVVSAGALAQKRTYVPARAVGAFVPKLTRKAFEKFGFSAAILITDWAGIVGRELAGYTAPERLKWPRGTGSRDEAETGEEARPGATLVLRVDPARALDVEYNGRQLIDRINGYFGYRAIAEMRILQAPLARPPQAAPHLQLRPGPCEAPELEAIADERLRAALTRMKSGLMGRRTAA